MSRDELYAELRYLGYGSWVSRIRMGLSSLPSMRRTFASVLVNNQPVQRHVYHAVDACMEHEVRYVA